MSRKVDMEKQAHPSGPATTVRESLRRLEDEGWALYLEELRRLDAPAVEEQTADDWDTPLGQFLRSDAGHPLGHGYPTGAPLAGDETGRHIDRWQVVLRADPCAYCGLRPARTIDHIEPQSDRNRTTHTWLNLTASCGSCNVNKRAMPLLLWLARRRAGSFVRRRLALAREEKRGFGHPDEGQHRRLLVG